MAEKSAPDPQGPKQGLIGQVLDGRFRVEAAIGHGAMGTVYKAEHLDLARSVALKVLHPELTQKPDMRARFMREARTASLLSHRGSVTVHDFGDWGGHLCIAMEYLDGTSLGSLLADAFPLRRERLLTILIQLCDVLTAAHSLDLLHRDLKPDNILLVTEPNGRETIKVVDFGLAILLKESAGARITSDGSMAGTPVYMSPEQALMSDLDHRSDIYAFGCVMYEMLCGMPPFRGRSPVDIFSKHLYHEPVPPIQRARAGQVDQALNEIALWCIEKEPNNRPQTAGDIAARLRKTMVDIPPSRTERPEWNLPGIDRNRRVAAAGIRPLTQRMAAIAGEPQGRVAVVQGQRQPYIVTPQSVLEAQDFEVVEVLSIDALDGHERIDVDAVVFDLRPAVDEALDVLHREMALGILRNMTVIVVGPTASFEAISRSLAAGAADYLAESMLAKLPRKIVRAVRRAERPETRRVPRPMTRRRPVSGVDSDLQNTNRMGGLSAEPKLADTLELPVNLRDAAEQAE